MPLRDARGRFVSTGGPKFRAPSAAVEAGRARRAARAGQESARTQWFIDEVSDKVAMSARKRVRVATNFLRDKVVQNISKPVTVGVGPRGGRVVTGRSKPGEYPRADFTLLMKSIFADVRETMPGVYDGYVGTPLDYGLILETRMDRSFLLRTLNEERGNITRILTGPIT